MESKTRRRSIFSKIGIFTALALGGFGVYSFADIRSSRGAIPKTSVQAECYAAEQRAANVPPPPDTIVTAYFELKRSKHSLKEYDAWMRNMLSLQDAMVIFTSPGLVSRIKSLRAHAVSRTRVVAIELTDTWIAGFKNVSFWRAQLDMDPEKKIHGSYELFWIWLSKSWFVDKAIRMNPFGSDRFVWSDIGSFRNAEYNGKRLIRHPNVIPRDAILVMSWRPPKPSASWHVTKQEFWVAGAHMAGRIGAWKRFHEAFTDTVKEYTREGFFIGEDQTIIQSTCQRKKDLCAVVTPNLVKGSVWFGLRDILHCRRYLLDQGPLLLSWQPPLPESKQHLRKEASYTKKTNKCVNDDFRPQRDVAVWTMLTDGAGYAEGAIKLGYSVKHHTTLPLDLVVMELSNKPLKDETWSRLRNVGWKRCVVNRIGPLDESGTFGRFQDQFTKLHAWGMTVYKTLLYLDSDTLVMRPIDDLLRINLGNKSIGVARDYAEGKWLNTFNMGVFLIHPDAHEHRRLCDLQKSGAVKFQTSMAEQGFLNSVYKTDWHDIGFSYNANLAIFSQDRFFWNQNESDIRIIHFTMIKPWECSSEYRKPCLWWKRA